MNRRGFLKAFTQAAIGLAVAPALAQIAPGATPVSLPAKLPNAGAITYAMMEEAYRKIVSRPMQPDYIVCSRSQYNVLRRLMNAET